MNRLNTTSVSLAVTPTVLSTLFSHYLNRKPLRERPTAHLSYDEGLHLIRSFLDFASHHTVEELQAFTAQWVPHPQWVKVEYATIPQEQLQRSAELLCQELGPDGIRRVGGQQWWRWRNPKAPLLEAEWIEMRTDANERKKSGAPVTRVMMYIHGGAYFFGSVDEHRYQMQRHARKLKARVFAPKYRLAPQYPFPCGLHDCLSAYLYLLETQDPSTIILAGDSAGGGMVVSLLCILRNQGIPLPAGAILISPWVDLTHSFPSVAGEAPFDYIPQAGFHHKPSRAWPPLNNEEIKKLREEAEKSAPQATKPANESTQTATQPPAVDSGVSGPAGVSAAPGNVEKSTTLEEEYLSVEIDGTSVQIKEQIQLYTTNLLLSHPLVSPVMQPTLGGLPPLLIMVGGGEVLRDEQVYLAHKCANPQKYAPRDNLLTEKEKEQLQTYKPTDVQLQVWDDLCHVAPTLSFTRPAKHMYRSIAQFGAWALARAQKTGIDILDDEAISVITSSGSDSDGAEDGKKVDEVESEPGQVGKAGDPLPPFRKHMIRQRITRHGVTLPLPAETELPGCCIDPAVIGIPKQEPVRRWMATRRQWDLRYFTAQAKVHKKIIKDIAAGFQEFGPGEFPPPSALAGRRRVKSDLAERKKTKSIGLALWSLWGSKHDEATVEREQKADQAPEQQSVTGDEGRGARPYEDIESQQPATNPDGIIRSRSRRKTVTDENQTGIDGVNEDTPVATLIEMRREKEDPSGLLSPTYAPQTGVAGKRPFLGGIAMPFSLNKDAETASMVTLNSAVSPAVTPGITSVPNPAVIATASHVDVSAPPAPEDAVRAEQLLSASNPNAGPEVIVTADQGDERTTQLK